MAKQTAAVPAPDFDNNHEALADLARSARSLADTIKMLRKARLVTLSELTTDRQRADAYHSLMVHEPEILGWACRIANVAERIAFGRGK